MSLINVQSMPLVWPVLPFPGSGCKTCIVNMEWKKCPVPSSESHVELKFDYTGTHMKNNLVSFISSTLPPVHFVPSSLLYFLSSVSPFSLWYKVSLWFYSHIPIYKHVSLLVQLRTHQANMIWERERKQIGYRLLGLDTH